MWDLPHRPTFPSPSLPSIAQPVIVPLAKHCASRIFHLAPKSILGPYTFTRIWISVIILVQAPGLQDCGNTFMYVNMSILVKTAIHWYLNQETKLFWTSIHLSIWEKYCNSFKRLDDTCIHRENMAIKASKISFICYSLHDLEQYHFGEVPNEWIADFHSSWDIKGVSLKIASEIQHEHKLLLD